MLLVRAMGAEKAVELIGVWLDLGCGSMVLAVRRDETCIQHALTR